jgi:1,3-propanediol dehydrogenase
MYDFLMPAVNLMGAGSVKEIGNRCEILGGKKVLIVTDKVMLQIGIAGEVIDYIEDAGLEIAIFDGVEPNPKDRNVEAGVKVFNEEKCDMIVTIGGGSSHDCGKGIGIMATHPGKISDYAGIETLTNALPPMVCVNTTAGTASEVTRHCVITNTETNVKFVVSWRNLPQVSINDPVLMIKKPAALTAATGMDALTHALETYVSLGANPVTDAQAIEAISKLSKDVGIPSGLSELNVDAKDLEAMAVSALKGGNAGSNPIQGKVGDVVKIFEAAI